MNLQNDTRKSSEIINLIKRPRRNRKSDAIRALVQETQLHARDLIAPLFIIEGRKCQIEIESMPGIFRYTTDLLVKEVAALYSQGVRAVNLFPVIAEENKNSKAMEAVRQGNLLHHTLITLKREIPQMCLIVDIALDPYTDHGHDGLVDENGRIDNDSTLQVLGDMSILAADAGADIVAPSDMMDGRVGYLRNKLDAKGHTDVGILAYSAKYASSFYGPFRDALKSAPKFGNKKTYQMNPANQREALLELALDEQEGADMLLIKPALAYLDIVALARQQTNLPLGAYHVSGEYSMVMAAGEKGWLDIDSVFYESLLSIKRAGCDFIFTYAAHRMAKILKDF